jgi:hypothetical protein
MAPAFPSRLSCQRRSRQRRRSEKKQMVILCPAHGRQRGCSQKNPGQAPKIDRPVPRMAASSFRTEHRDDARDGAGESQQDMNPHNGQKHRVGRGYIDSCYARDPIARATWLATVRGACPCHSRRRWGFAILVGSLRDNPRIEPSLRQVRQGRASDRRSRLHPGRQSQTCLRRDASRSLRSASPAAYT